MDPIDVIAPELAGRRILSQHWRDLVFVHWRVEPAEVAPLLPEGITPDVFDGTSWVGLIPFQMLDSAFLGLPRIPYFGSFTEINVRLYGVDREGRRGVVFRSLEASRLPAVVAARATSSLPYYWSDASVRRADGTLDYRSQRHTDVRASTLIEAWPSSIRVEGEGLAAFLTARWTLFQSRRGRTIAMPNEHEPWPLFEAEIEQLDDSLVAAAGIRSVHGREPDSVLYSPGVRTSFGLPTAADARG